jgi:pimeloyl-ACP methyl ester carboxylesterase
MPKAMYRGTATQKQERISMRTYLTYRVKRLKRGIIAKSALLSPHVRARIMTERPLQRLDYFLREDRRNLIVFLPGIGDVAEDFFRRGFVQELERRGIAADAMAIDAHFGYYAARAIHSRLTEDVIASARTMGYENIWLVGVSLGGFGAASYAAMHPDKLAGIILFAPYLGPATLIEEISAAGGIMGWEPGHIVEGDYQRALWAWFKQHLSSTEESPLPIYLGYGKRDKFEKANTLLSEVLPEGHVFPVSGGHDWRTWKKIWRMVLSRWHGQGNALPVARRNGRPETY